MRPMSDAGFRIGREMPRQREAELGPFDIFHVCGWRLGHFNVAPVSSLDAFQAISQGLSTSEVAPEGFPERVIVPVRLAPSVTFETLPSQGTWEVTPDRPVHGQTEANYTVPVYRLSCPRHDPPAKVERRADLLLQDLETKMATGGSRLTLS